MLLRQEVVPRVPRFALPAGVGCDKSDMEPAFEQLDFGLGLVVPIAALPRPRIAGSGFLGNDHDAPAFAVLQRTVDTKASYLARGRRHGRDRTRGIVHDEVITVESLVPCGLWAIEWDVSIGREQAFRSRQNSEDGRCSEAKTQISSYTLVHKIDPLPVISCFTAFIYSSEASPTPTSWYISRLTEWERLRWS